MAIGGERNVEFVSVDSSEARQLAHEFDHATAQQWLSTSYADFFDSEADQHSRHAQVVAEGQIAEQRALVSGAAVNTLVIATVGDRNPEVSDGAAEFVGERHG